MGELEGVRHGVRGWFWCLDWRVKGSELHGSGCCFWILEASTRVSSRVGLERVAIRRGRATADDSTVAANPIESWLGSGDVGVMTWAHHPGPL